MVITITMSELTRIFFYISYSHFRFPFQNINAKIYLYTIYALSKERCSDASSPCIWIQEAHGLLSFAELANIMTMYVMIICYDEKENIASKNKEGIRIKVMCFIFQCCFVPIFASNTSIRMPVQRDSREHGVVVKFVD